MSGKDIALTTGGVLATMVLAWLLYRIQQRDQARAAAQANDQAAQDATETIAADPYNNALTDAWLATSLAQQVSATGTTTNTPATEGTSAAVSDLGAYYDSTDTQNLLSNIVTAFAGSMPSGSLDLAPPSMTLDEFNAITIPAISGVTQTATGNIPITAAEAAAQARLMVSPSSAALYESSTDTSSHPVDVHPIYDGSPIDLGRNQLNAIRPILQIGAA